MLKGDAEWRGKEVGGLRRNTEAFQGNLFTIRIAEATYIFLKLITVSLIN